MTANPANQDWWSRIFHDANMGKLVTNPLIWGNILFPTSTFGVLLPEYTFFPVVTSTFCMDENAWKSGDHGGIIYSCDESSLDFRLVVSL